MGDVCVDYLESYRKFFDNFTLSVDPGDQLPVKVAGYNLVESEIAGAVADWALQYLEQRKCPPFLLAHLVRTVVKEVRVMSKIDPLSCGYRGEVGDYLSLKLMQACINKLIAVCARYRDNAELSSLPPPQPLPPVTSCAIKNSRRSMEDRHVVIHDFHNFFNIKGYGPASYYAVFDGHNGIDAAIYSVSHLHQYLAESHHYPTNPVLALRDACFKTDQLFSSKAERENLHGGTTAVIALMRPKEKKLYVAWLGDSQAVLVRRGVPLQIVKPHKPDRSDERDRIEGMGGTVLFWGAWRVNGQLAVSRAIGDVEYKPYVTAEPDVEELTLDGTEDFLILACDGLWDFVSEQEATSAVYKQLQENPEDLEAVGHRLVALAKEQSSQDNISVVVVFLAQPAEVARRRLMETASANPFVSQNGTDMYRGVPSNGEHFDDDEDFGPETDVDMVDDVLVSPAKSKARGKELEDDLERQRQQMPEYDPADLDCSRDTPTPPADELASNANADNLAESGGEESEEEWNYIPGKDTKSATDTQEEDDMSSQLNPNAAEFVPVSPTRLLLLDDAIISASSGLPFDKSLENIQVPSELEFSSEISHRPGDLELANGPKRGDDYFMRDNFSTLRNKGKDFSVSSAFSGEGDTSNIPFNTMTTQVSEHIPFDKMEAVQNIVEKENIFGTNNDFSSNAFAATNIFGKSDPMTTSVMGLKDFEISPEVDAVIPDTPKSTTVEAPVSPAEDVSPLNHQRDLDSPTDDHLDTQKTPELMSPGDGPHDALISGQERTSSSGFESESGAEEGDTNVPEESSEGFVTEHRRSPPIDLSFKPIQNFSHTNPFGALQTPTSTTPLDQFNVNTEDQETLIETPKKDTQFDKLVNDGTDFLQNTPSSFISLRSPSKEPVPFNQLESPEEILQFEQPPNANSSFLATELPKSPNPHEALEDVISTLNPEPVHSDFVNESFASTLNVNELTQDLFTDEIIPEVEETSFTTESSHHTIAATISHVDLDTTEGFLSEESKIQLDEKECEQKSKLEEVDPAENICDISPTAVDQVLTAFDDIKDDLEISSKHETQEEVKDNIEIETKEMNLEFESHIATSDTTLQDLKNIDDEFEVISKDELTLSDDKELKESESSLPTPESVLQQDNVDLMPSSKQTNPFVVDDFLTTAESEMSKEKEPIVVETSFTNNFASVIDSFDTALKEDLIASDQSTLLSSPVELTSPVEPQATKTVSYQTLTPADEPKLNKIESYVTGIEEEVTKSPVLEETVTEAPKSEYCPVVENVIIAPVLEQNEEVTTAPVIEKVEEVIVAPVAEEPVLIKSEPVQSQVVTETLIATLEDTSEVPLSVTTTEVPSSAGTPPPTPAPGIDGKDESQKTDILVAAVAAAGAVAAGTAAVVADKEAKKATTGPSKKPAAGVTKKPSETTAKPAGKPAPIKAPAAKPVATKTTTTTKSTSSTATKPALGAAKTATAATKPASSATAPKVPVAKPIAGALAPKKPAPPTKLAATTKPTTSAPKPAVSAVPKTVPKQLSVNKTSTSAMKPSSKPTTPTSKPTTPTTPKSPSVMKSEAVKSPPRPAVRSTLTTSRPASATTKSDESAEKKPLLNGEIKPLAKKIDVPAKKLVSASKPATTARPAAPIKSTLTATKAVPAKTGAPPQPKAKAPTTTVTKTAMPAPIKRPTPTTTAKPADKTGKETVNKQISNTKPAVNGKTVPAKTAAGNKKTDLKVNAKPTAIKSGPIKKPEEVTKEEEKPTQIQEDNVTTTNGYMEHIIDSNESMKIEELAPVIVDGVN